ncbi:hypothetical protein AB0H88_40530 [Nonomuraea sp. NPDC050680]
MHPNAVPGPSGPTTIGLDDTFVAGVLLSDCPNRGGPEQATA